MKKNKIPFLLLLLLAPLLAFEGLSWTLQGEEFHDEPKIDTFFERVNGLSNREIIRIGDSYPEGSDTAVALYSIVASRYSDGMEEERRIEVCIGLMRAGDAYYRQGNYTQAFENYTRSYEICEACRDQRLLPDICLKMGSLYCTMEDYETGIYYFERAYALGSDYPDPGRQYSILANMTGAYNLSGRVEDAEKALELSRALALPPDTIRAYMEMLNHGMILVNKTQYPEALDLFRHAASYAARNKMEARYECSAYEEMYKAWRLVGDMDSTLHYLSRCLDLASRCNWDYIEIQCLKAYSEIYAEMGLKERALRCKERYLYLSDSVFNREEVNRMRHLQSISEMRKMNERIASLQAERERREEVVREQRRLLLSLGIGLVLVLSVLSVVLGQKKKIEHAYRDLYKMNRAAMAAEDGAIEKEDARASRPEMALVSQSGAAPQGQGRSAAVSEVRKGELLSAEQRQSLLDAIGKVMEDPGTYCSPDFSLGKLASLVHSNSKYVSWVINETYQKNFNAFVNDYRIRTARSRLADIRNYGNYTIKAIAESVGYKSNTTFVNAFKDITGMPPSVFLKLVKEEK